MLYKPSRSRSGSHDSLDQANNPENKSHCDTDQYLRAQTTVIVLQIEAMFVALAPRYVELAVDNSQKSVRFQDVCATRADM
jgi:hypothetical protein